MANKKKYVSLSKLSTFLDNLKNLFALQSSLDAKVPTSRTINGKSLSTDVTLSASDIGADVSGAASSAVSAHNTSTSAHGDIRDLITELRNKLNNFLNVDDATTDQLSEVLTLIENNKGTLESLTASKVNVSDIINNLTTNVTNKPLSAAQGVALKDLIDTLQDEFDFHNDNTIGHITSAERTNWNAAKTHADSAHAPSNAEKNQNAFGNIVHGNNIYETYSAASTTDAIVFRDGNGITIDVENDTSGVSVDISVASGTVNTAGIVRLTDSTSSTSTTTAATPNSVRSAYDLANTANDAAAQKTQVQIITWEADD